VLVTEHDEWIRLTLRGELSMSEISSELKFTVSSSREMHPSLEMNASAKPVESTLEMMICGAEKLPTMKTGPVTTIPDAVTF
jgi:hypothetical protein